MKILRNEAVITIRFLLNVAIFWWAYYLRCEKKHCSDQIRFDNRQQIITKQLIDSRLAGDRYCQQYVEKIIILMNTAIRAAMNKT